METLHPHSQIIDLLGKAVIIDYLGLTPQAVGKWRYRGVPKHHRRTVAMLLSVAGHDSSAMREALP